MSNKIEIFRPFSPSIGKFTMPKELIDTLNNYVEEIIDNKEKSIKLDRGKKLAGEVTQELTISEDFIKKELLQYLSKTTENYIKLSEDIQITEFLIKSAWIVRQFKNEYNPIHWHSGHISGVAYLKLPNSFGDNIKKHVPNELGCINFIHGSKMFLSNSKITAQPKVGDFYLFPNYLMHSVNPFFAEGERRSFSFNATIDKKIYEVYN